MKKMMLAWLLATALLLTACRALLPRSRQPERPEKVLLTMLIGESSTDPGIDDLILEKIEREFPNVEIEREIVDWGTGFDARLNAKIASGETPDIIIGKAQDVQAFYDTGALGAFPASLAGCLEPEAVRAGTIDARLCGLVYNQLYQGVLYNKNMFYRYNFEVPETTGELAAIVSRLNRVGVTPYATHFQETWYTGNILMQFAINEVFSRVPDWGERLRAGEVSFSDSEDYRACVAQVIGQYENSWSDSMNITQSTCDLRFADERAVMYVTGSWSVQTLQSMAPYRDIGIFPFPTREGGASLIAEPNLTFMKGADSPHDALIDEIFASLLSDAELAQTICAFTQTDTCLKGVEVESLAMIREDIERYRDAGRIVSASIGNNQLIWAYQYECAASLWQCLRGETSLDDVLAHWDSLRMESSRANESK